jgi:uncharacterized oxidoreductase
MYNAPYGAILPFGLHKGGGLAVICDLLAGALTGGRTHSPRTIKKDGTAIINNMLSMIIDPEAMGGTAMFEDEVETFIGWVKSARPQAGVAEVLAPGDRVGMCLVSYTVSLNGGSPAPAPPDSRTAH